VFFEVTGISKIFPKSRFLASYRMTWFDYNTTIEVDQPMATFLLTTRKVYELVGGMDTDFPIFFNDVDWCFRVKQCEKKIYYSPQPEIAHYGGAATSKANRAAMAVESKTSLLKFYKKHYYGKVNPAIYNIVQLAVRISLFVKKAQTLVRKSMGK
jgi:GT2 family glycosyltransferase